MAWIHHPTTLEGKRVRLVPLHSSHFLDLITIGKQEKIWSHMSLVGHNSEALLTDLKSAILKRATSEQYAFTIYDIVNDKVIGNTRLHNIYPEHRKLEIGYTWYDPSYWGTGYNTECKLLLLTYCFETLKTVRVQLQTNEDNIRSRTAILKIGATFEGILRKERIKPDGTFRNTAMFSIIDDEWDAVKKMLEEKVKK